MKRQNTTAKRFAAALLAACLLALAVSGCQIGSRQPRARYGAAMVWDAEGDQMVLFGGRAKGLFGERVLNDTWLFDLKDQVWRKVNTSQAPPPRLSPGLVIDPQSRQLIMFGGLGVGQRFGDTWILDLESAIWEEVTPSTSPSPRSDMGFALDEDQQKALLFGGYCQEFERENCAETWEFDLITWTWTKREPADSPPVTYGLQLISDPLNLRFLGWGGHMSGNQGGVYQSLGYSDVLWSFSLTTGEWLVIKPEGRSGPPARYWHHLVMDPISAEVVLYGGDGGQGYLEDTWIYDSIGNQWRRVQSVDPPLARINAASAFDVSREQWILFGGLGEGFTVFKDTWAFSPRTNTWERLMP